MSNVLLNTTSYEEAVASIKNGESIKFGFFVEYTEEPLEVLAELDAGINEVYQTYVEHLSDLYKVDAKTYIVTPSFASVKWDLSK
jgi:outer membrane scaffolding protein for murein synthesis (MipA/OmpV family)